MNAEARQASLIIDSVAKAIANWTVDQQVEKDPQLPARYGQSWRSDWVAHTLSQLTMLAQAISVRSPELFVASMGWTCQSFKSRGVSESDFVLNARCLQDVLNKELPAEVRSIAGDFLRGAVESVESLKSDAEVDAIPATATGRTVLRYIEAILEGDRSKAEGIVFAALQSGSTVPAIYEKILAPAQSKLGTMWHRGEITVADEHFGSTTTEFVMAQLRPHLVKADPKRLTMLATSTPGDLHEIGLRMVADLFEADGWNVFYLGANTPAGDVVEILERRGSDLLALSVNTALTIRSAGELIDAVRGNPATAATRILVGGPPFRQVPQLWRELGADGCARSAVEAVQCGNELVRERSG
jgi:MerR family transcriptional regulator, light-induced transcriptional regulator